jgi:hypothetical protein
MTKPFLDKDVEIRLDDRAGRGDLFVVKVDGGYLIWIQMSDIDSSFFEPGCNRPITTLSEAMMVISEIIEHNCDNYFYEE